MKIARKLGLAAIVAASAATATMVSAAPASADGHSRCSGGWFCLYENNDFNRGNDDHWRNFKRNKRNFNNYNWLRPGGGNSGDPMDNEASSVKNRTGHCVTLYQHIGYGGEKSEFRAGDNDGYLRNNAVGDNRASAVRMTC